MKKLLIINPNSSRAMTEEIERSVRDCRPEGFAADVVRIPDSPEALESYGDYTLAGANMLRYVEENSRIAEEYDGVLVACYGDPGLYALKEKLAIPVIGIAEASMSAALLLGYKFSIVAAVPKAKAMMEQLVESYGLQSRLASVESLDLEILTFMNHPQALKTAFKQCAHAAAEKGADTVIYGCAGMTMLQRMAADFGIEVIDPVRAGVCALAALAGGGFHVSKQGLFREM